MASVLRCVLVAIVIVAPHALQAQPAPVQRNEMIWWPRLVDGFESSSLGYTLLGSHRSIEVSLLMSNDASSVDSVMFDAGFFRQVAMTLVDATSGQTAATVSEWRETGFCAGQPDCWIDGEIFLGPGLGAAFVAVLLTFDGQPLAEGEYVLRVALAACGESLSGRLWPSSHV